MSAAPQPGPTPDCVLVLGGPACLCPADTAWLTDAELLARATAKFRWQQRAPAPGRAAARRGLDELLDHVRRSRNDPQLIAELLRMAVLGRVLHREVHELAAVQNLLTEYGALAEVAADPRMLGEAATLRAHHAVVFGQAEDALVDAATALAVLTEVPVAEPMLARSLNGLVLVLLRLGAHELADEVSRRAIAAAVDGPAIDRLVHQLNRVRLQLSWALRLERGGRDAAAATRFVGAAQSAQVAARLWDAALGHVGGPAVQECAVIGAALALARPGSEHLAMLQGLSGKAQFAEDRIGLGIAVARCLLADGRALAAVRALVPLHRELQDESADGVLSLALHREFARADDVASGSPDHAVALGHYAAALEEELWALREARITALRSHSEHHRLTREHGAIAAQALQDPLTGLPNRRALDLHLAEATGNATAQPCAVALIDLDGFKGVNDGRSHAAGDAVLRVVATTIRTVLRAQDVVARYGGDEFVVVMPSTSLPVARTVLQRVAETVAGLPEESAAGVTTSVGVVWLPHDGDPTQALAAADAAMYRAKRAGGGTVVTGSAVRRDTKSDAEFGAGHDERSEAESAARPPVAPWPSAVPALRPDETEGTDRLDPDGPTLRPSLVPPAATVAAPASACTTASLAPATAPIPTASARALLHCAPSVEALRAPSGPTGRVPVATGPRSGGDPGIGPGRWGAFPTVRTGL